MQDKGLLVVVILREQPCSPHGDSYSWEGQNQVEVVQVPKTVGLALLLRNAALGSMAEVCRSRSVSWAFLHLWDVEGELKTVSQIFPNTDSADKSGE